MQEALGKQLEEMKSKMDGANKGESQSRGGQMSKQLAEMAAQQAALRELAKKRAQELNEDGSGAGSEMQKIAEEMEELERDLLNREVDAGTIERFNDIMTRLLEAEEADRLEAKRMKESQELVIRDYTQKTRKTLIICSLGQTK